MAFTCAGLHYTLDEHSLTDDGGSLNYNLLLPFFIKRNFVFELSIVLTYPHETALLRGGRCETCTGTLRTDPRETDEEHPGSEKIKHLERGLSIVLTKRAKFRLCVLFRYGSLLQQSFKLWLQVLFDPLYIDLKRFAKR